MILTSIQVLIGAFAMFTIARLTQKRLIEHSGWLWVVLVALLAITSMLVHRHVLGSAISPPFYTSLLFGITLAGLTPTGSDVSKWHKRGIYGVVAGTVAGWISYAEVVSM